MKKALQTLVLTLFLPLFAMAQTATIKGVVVDAGNGDELIGVNVVVKGTTIGTSTGIEGDFQLKVSPGKVTLVFSYLGYDRKEEVVEIAAGQTKTLQVKLSEEATILTTTVVSASRYEKKLSEETVSLDVIKPSFVENQNINTVDDAIKRNPGVNIIDGQANIRGGSGFSYGAGTRVLLLLDDLPILQADAGFPNWSSIPLENIGQIEIIKGAASALYGSSAMNGIINVRTAYATGDPVTKVSMFSTVYDNPRPYTDPSGNVIKNDWWNLNALDVGGSKKDLAGWTRPYETGFNVGHRQKFGKFDLVLGAQAILGQEWKYGAFENRGRLSVQTRYRINEKMNFGVNGNVQVGKSGSFFLWNGNDGIDRYKPLDIVGDPTITNARRITVDPFFNYSDDKGNRHKVLTRWYKVDNDNSNDQGNFSDFFYAEYQYQKRFSDINLTLSGGAVASYVTVVAPLYGNQTLTGRNLAVYAQADKKFFDKLNVSLGLRMENNEQSETPGETKPVMRFGANYQAAEYTFIRGSFGQGYRFPTLAEKFIQTNLGTGVQITSNPGLTSETGLTAEIGFKQGIKLGGFSAFFDVAAFYLRYKDMMEFNPIVVSAIPLVLGFQSQNVGNTQIFGIETSIMGEGKLFNKFPTTAMLGYTYIDPRYLNFDPAREGAEGIAVDINGNPYNVLKYRFRHTFTGQWDINIKGFDIGANLQYFSFMENYDGVFNLFIPGLIEYRDERRRDNFADLDPRRWFKGDLIADVRAGYTFRDANNNKYKVSFLVRNVANRDYTLRPALMEAPRSYSLRVDLEF
jgi:outer membrane receptor protein involved in Fe transport